MNSRKRKLKKGEKKHLLRRFITIMLSTFVAGVVVVIGGIAGYQRINKDGNMFSGFSKLTAEEKKEKEDEKLKTNVAVFGVDIDGYRTDTIFVVHFDGERNSADLVSIPRDTIVNFSDTEYEEIRAVNRNIPRRVKLNEITAYTGIKNVKEYTVKEIERMLGIKIDNYVTVEIEAFRKIVEIIDGVDLDVPRRMNYYDSAGGFSVDLQPGMQHLNGAQAEGLVRFRKDKYGGGYVDGDVGRIQTQQIFLKAFAEKLLSPENIRNFPKMIPTMFQHVKTDINILDLPKYYGYASTFNADAIAFHTIPGAGSTKLGPSYFFPDMDKLDEFVQEIFYKKPEADVETGETAKIIEDKSVKIEVLNGGAPTGAAGNVKETIENDGYDVINVANYTGAHKAETIIYTRDILKAEQFKKYFSNCTISIDSSLKKGIDIQIVIGSDGI